MCKLFQPCYKVVLCTIVIIKVLYLFVEHEWLLKQNVHLLLCLFCQSLTSFPVYLVSSFRWCFNHPTCPFRPNIGPSIASFSKRGVAWYMTEVFQCLTFTGEEFSFLHCLMYHSQGQIQDFGNCQTFLNLTV